MDINNNIQINTFSKGMNTDTSDALLDSLEYRYARNVRPICGTEENDNEMHLIEGVELAQYVSQYNKIYAATKIRHMVVIIGSKDGESWEVDVFKARKNKGTYEPDIVFGKCTEMLTNPEGEGDPALSLVTRYEDEDNIKLYIADGVHNIMVVRLDGATRGLDLIKDISSIVEHSFGGFSDYAETSGSLKPALVLHAYVLYDKYGASSQLSPLTKPYYITKTENGNAVGYKKDEVSGSGLLFTIHETAGDFDKIKIYRITYQEYGQQPSVELICDEELRDVDFTFVDSGSNTISQLSVAEFIALDNISIVPREIESKHDYLFASNIKYQISNNSKAVRRFSRLDLSTESASRNANLDMSIAYSSSVWPGFAESAEAFYLASTNKLIDWAYINVIGDSGIKSLLRGEVYRYGIILYDKYGNKWPVKWFADVRTPDLQTSPITNGNQFVALNIVVYLNLSRVNSGIGDDYFTAYEVVRCERTLADRHVLTQGIVGRPFETYKFSSSASDAPFIDYVPRDNSLQTRPGIRSDIYSESTNTLCPSGIMTMYNMVSDNLVNVNFSTSYDQQADQYVPNYDLPPLDGVEEQEGRYAKSSYNTLIFASPEICYNDDIDNVLKSRNTSVDFLYRYDVKNIKFSQDLNFDDDLYSYVYKNGSTPTLPSPRTKYPLYGYYTQSDFGYGLIFHMGQTLRVNEDIKTIINPYYICVRPSIYKYINPNFYTQISNWSALLFPGIESDENMFDSYGTKLVFNYFDAQKTLYYGDPYNIRPAKIYKWRRIITPEQGGFAKEKTLSIKQNSVVIQDKTYIPWSAPFLIGYDNESQVGDVYNDGTLVGSNLDYPIGMSGKGLLLRLEDGLNGDQVVYDIASNIQANSASSRVPDRTLKLKMFGISVANIINNSYTPYGGYSTYARENGTYLQHGIYNNQDSAIIVDDGDTYLVDFYYTALHAWYDVNYKNAPVMSTVYKFPVESSINISIDHGDSYRTNPSPYILNTPTKMKDYAQDKSQYLYNMAYSSEQTSRFFTGQDKDDMLNNKMDCRVVYSLLKQNNESIDSWLKFKSANYIDVDTRYGEITNLRLFKDTLVFWLKYATGVLSVNERTIIQDANDTNIILGNGDVLQRYDYISTMYGMTKDLFSDTQSNTTLYWWDSLNKDIVGYSGGQAAMPLTKVKHVYNHITNNTSLEKPSLTYDPKNNEVLFNVVSDGVDSTTGNLIERPLAYNENIQQFTGVYDMPFDYAVSLPDRMFFMKNGKVFHRYDSNSTESNGTLLNPLFPYIKYIVNKDPMYNKTFDIQTFGGRIYGGDNISDLTLRFSTPLKQSSEISGDSITNREYDFRLTIPRNNNSSYGDRMRGKTMQCEIESTSNSTDFSLQYITTKYRMSWS